MIGGKIFGGLAVIGLAAAVTAAGWAMLERGRRAVATAAYQVEVAARAEAERSIKALIETVDASNRNIERMLDQSIEDQRLITEQLETLQGLASDLDGFRAEIREVDENDVEARDWLGTRLPPGVLPLVNRPAAGPGRHPQ